MNLKIKAILFVSLLLIASAQASDSSPISSDASKPWDVNITLLSSIYLPTPRPISDVFFVLNNTTEDLVYRIERSQAEDPVNLLKTAYATTNATLHDTYKLSPNALGPFPKGADLGFTLEQWLAANGRGSYIEEDGNATLNLIFEKLVPNGTYSLWQHRITMPPNYRYIYYPIGAPDSSQNTFKADAEGHAVFNLSMRALQESGNLTYQDYVAKYVIKAAPITSNVTWTLIAAAYHSDGKTHGSEPGELGKNVHFQMVHLMYPKPARDYQEWKNMTAVSVKGGAEAAQAGSAEAKKQPGFEGITAISVILAAAGLILQKNFLR